LTALRPACRSFAASTVGVVLACLALVDNLGWWQCFSA